MPSNSWGLEFCPHKLVPTSIANVQLLVPTKICKYTHTHLGVFVRLCDCGVTVQQLMTRSLEKRGDMRRVCPQIYLTSIPAHTHSDCFALAFTSSKITSNCSGQVALLNSYSLSLHSHSHKHIRRQRCQLLWTATLFNSHFDTHARTKMSTKTDPSARNSARALLLWTQLTMC